MYFLIPMAGIGSRMMSENPKALIDVLGKPMIQRVIENFYDNRLQFIFCVNKKDIEFYAIDKFILSICDNALIIKVDKLTEGPASTCLLAKFIINSKTSLFITNCDQIINDWNLSTFLEFQNENNYDGIIGIFKSNNIKNSYVKINNDNLVIEVKEKKIISNLATNGLHYWKHGEDFVTSSELMIKNNDRTNGEFYVAPTYNYLIDNNKKIGIYHFNEHFPIGTKEDLELYVSKHLQC